MDKVETEITDIFYLQTSGTGPQSVTGNLYMKNGLFYRLEGGLVRWMRDRNGNRIAFEYDGNKRISKAIDSLKREVTFAYAQNCGGIYGTCDIITYYRYVNGIRQPRTVRISRTTLEFCLREGGPQSTANLFPELDGTNLHNPANMVSALWLPGENERGYEFRYNAYGEISRVVLPTGGKFEYEYGKGLPNGHDLGSPFNSGVIGCHKFKPGTPSCTYIGNPEDPTEVITGVYRRLMERRVYKNASDTDFESKTTYERPLVTGTYPNSATEVVVKNIIKNQSGVEAQVNGERHIFKGDPANSILSNDPVTLAPWQDGKEEMTEALNDSNAAIRKVVNNWEQGYLPGGARIADTTTTLIETTQVSKQHFEYDSYVAGNKTYSNNNVVLLDEYDFGNMGPGNLLRRTRTDYLSTNEINGTIYDNPYPLSLSLPIVHLRSLPTKVRVFRVVGTTEERFSETQYEYDSYSSGNELLLDRADISGPDVPALPMNALPDPCLGFKACPKSYAKRGNVTAVKRWLDRATPFSNIFVTTYQQYDIAGNVIKAIDAKGGMTIFDYTDNFGMPNGLMQSDTSPPELGTLKTFAFVTSVTNALIQNSYTQYDYYLGRPVDSQDLNGVVSSAYYNDLLDRPTEGRNAANVNDLKNSTQFVYEDALTSRNISTRRDQDAFNDGKLQSKAKYDGLGRTIRQGSYEGGNNVWLVVDTEYDGLGRVKRISNPYRCGNFDAIGPAPISGETVYWTTTEYDTLSRVIKVTTPDTAETVTAYSGNAVTVTEPYDSGQVGSLIRKRSSYTDALGRLVKVIEDPGGNNYVTDYLYDPLNNLRQVTQDGANGLQQRRYFMYDSLSRLAYAYNPEQETITGGSSDPVTNRNQWTQQYDYDHNGNLVRKWDGRAFAPSQNSPQILNLNIVYSYDALNRLLTTNYSDGTPGVTRTYDNTAQDAYGKGRPWVTRAINAGTSDEEYRSLDQYDALGRPLALTQKFKSGTVESPAYQLKRTYDLAGHVKTQDYPASTSSIPRDVTYTYDNAGRLLTITGKLGDGVLRPYLDAMEYNAAGQMTNERFRTTNSLNHASVYNKRQQLVEVNLGTTAGADQRWNRGRLRFYYGMSAFNANQNNSSAFDNFDPLTDYKDNNGNIYVAEHRVPETMGQHGAVSTWSATQRDAYSYDALNRLTEVKGRQRSTNGSIIQDLYRQTFSYDRWGNRTISSVSGASVNGRNYSNQTVNGVATNRFTQLTYDRAGNVLSDSFGGNNFSYDAESRLVAAGVTLTSAGGLYVYDGDGRRTRFRPNLFSARPRWKYFIYGFDGELVAEYNNEAPPTNPSVEYGYRNGEKLIVANATSGTPGSGATITLAVPNGGFEAPPIGVGSSVYNPPGGVWTFTGAAGITGNGSRLNSGNENAPEGGQAAFLQGGETSTIAQHVSGFDATRNYQLIFQAAAATAGARGGKGEKGVTVAPVFEIFVDDVSLGVFQPSSASYTEYTTPIFRVTAGKAQVRFVARNRDGSEITALLDNVRIIGSAPTVGADIRWLVTDHLGTPRMVVGLGGQLADVTRHDYLPFGEEAGIGVGNGSVRVTGNGYGGDSVRMKFTGYERDGETGLDYARARYYSSVQGRFSSPDALLSSGTPTNPQSWNRYAYSLNSPIVLTDPNGLIWGYKDGEKNIKWFDSNDELEKAGYSVLQTFVYQVGETWYAVNPYANDYSKSSDRSDAVRSYWGMTGLAPSWQDYMPIWG